MEDGKFSSETWPHFQLPAREENGLTRVVAIISSGGRDGRVYKYSQIVNKALECEREKDEESTSREHRGLVCSSLILANVAAYM